MPRLFPDETCCTSLRVLWLYGFFTLLSNAAFLIGYYLLPMGILHQGTPAALAETAAAAPAFTSDLHHFTVRASIALGLSFGNVGMLGYICTIAATVGLGSFKWGGD